MSHYIFLIVCVLITLNIKIYKIINHIFMLIYEEVCIVLYGGSFIATNCDSRLVDCLLFEKLLAVAEAFPIFEDIKLLFEILEARFTLGEYIIFGDEK